jgi:hypothetical protein
MNTETERILEQLILEHGLETVRTHLSVLIPRSRWSDWQHLNSAVINTANHFNRQKGIQTLDEDTSRQSLQATA